MSSKYKFKDQDKLYFVSFAVVNWIDLFIRNEYKDILLESWKYCQANKGMELYAWCIMSSHVHLIIGSHGDKLENIMRDMKRHTSEELKKAIQIHPGESRREWMLGMMEKAGKENSNNINFQLWQQDNHPLELTTPEITHQKLDYLHYNPVMAGIVEKPEDYLYSSAIDYYTNRKGLIAIERIDPILKS
jgi:putative transposase